MTEEKILYIVSGIIIVIVVICWILRETLGWFKEKEEEVSQDKELHMGILKEVEVLPFIDEYGYPSVRIKFDNGFTYCFATDSVPDIRGKQSVDELKNHLNKNVRIYWDWSGAVKLKIEEIPQENKWITTSYT